ncbi:MAG: CoA transferase, partial [Pseudonocardiaceae bacterium]
LGIDASDLPEQFDREHWADTSKRVAEVFATRTRDEWAEVFADTDACVAPVLSLAEAPEHPHLRARGVFEPDADGSRPRVAPRFSRTPGLSPGEPHAAGQDSRAVLAACGLAANEIDDLVAAGVVRQASERPTPTYELMETRQ